MQPSFECPRRAAKHDAPLQDLDRVSTLRDSETTIKIKFPVFEGGGASGAERKIVQNAVFFFRGKRHDNKILKVQILLSKDFAVIAQAPVFPGKRGRVCGCKLECLGEGSK